jgi:hypothetical protein
MRFWRVNDAEIKEFLDRKRNSLKAAAVSISMDDARAR